MTRPAARTLVVVGLAACALAAAVAVSALAATGARAARPRLAKGRILRIADRAAAAAGDPTPTLIQYSEGTASRANRVAGGDRVPGNRWSYLIAERGAFTQRDVPLPRGAGAPSGDALTLVVDAATGGVSDIGVSNRYPRLAVLGVVRTVIRQLPPGCLQKAPTRLLPEQWRRARTTLAPAGANSIQLCRYSGLNARPPLTLDRARLLGRARPIKGLIGQFDKLPKAPTGAVACPSDDGSQIVAELGYRDGRGVPISVGLTGCRTVTNGSVNRDASGYGTPSRFGPALVVHLQRLLNHGGVTPSELVVRQRGGAGPGGPASRAGS